MMKVVTLLLLTTIVPFTQGQLVQLHGDVAICSNDEVKFWCSSEFPFLNWDISKAAGQSQITFSLDQNVAVGTMISRLLDTSPITALVTYNDGSSINATVTIMQATSLNDSTISCNGFSLNITVPKLVGPDFFSTKLALIYLQQNLGIFSVTLTPSPDLLNTEYVVTISPRPPHGPAEFTTHSSAITSLEINANYNITFFLKNCQERFYITLLYGRCPLFASSTSLLDLQYNISYTNVWTATTSCATMNISETYESECEYNGQWSTDLSGICSSSQDVVITEEPRTGENNKKETKAITVTTDKLRENEVSSSNSTPILLVIIPVGVVGSFTILAIGILFGLLCGIKYMKKKQKQQSEIPTYVAAKDQTELKITSDPLYDELVLKKETGVSMEQNIAYDKSKMTTFLYS